MFQQIGLAGAARVLNNAAGVFKSHDLLFFFRFCVCKKEKTATRNLVVWLFGCERLLLESPVIQSATAPALPRRATHRLVAEDLLHQLQGGFAAVHVKERRQRAVLQHLQGRERSTAWSVQVGTGAARGRSVAVLVAEIRSTRVKSKHSFTVTVDPGKLLNTVWCEGKPVDCAIKVLPQRREPGHNQVNICSDTGGPRLVTQLSEMIWPVCSYWLERDLWYSAEPQSKVTEQDNKVLHHFVSCRTVYPTVSHRIVSHQIVSSRVILYRIVSYCIA